MERLVSLHNLIKSDMRASMNRAAINDYIMIKESMSPVSQFDSRPVIDKWLMAKERHPKQQESDGRTDKFKNCHSHYVSKFLT